MPLSVVVEGRMKRMKCATKKPAKKKKKK